MQMVPFCIPCLCRGRVSVALPAAVTQIWDLRPWARCRRDGKRKRGVVTAWNAWVGRIWPPWSAAISAMLGRCPDVEAFAEGVRRALDELVGLSPATRTVMKA
jgi:hypothetical protein